MKETDELREFARGCAGGMGGDALRHIADRIDAAHRSALEKLAAQVDESERIGFDQGFASADDWLAQHEDAMAEHGWVKLPVDADGVPIHIGDYLHCDETGRDFHCRGYCCSVGENGERRWTVECSYDAYSGTSEYVSARRCHHHHAPTVEDVLREFAEKVTDSQIPGVHPTYEEAIAEYAAKLRLADKNEDACD